MAVEAKANHTSPAWKQYSSMGDAAKADGGGKAGSSESDTSIRTKKDASFYKFSPQKLEQLRSNKPWMKDPKFFKKVIVSAGASIKMVSSCSRRYRGC